MKITKNLIIIWLMLVLQAIAVIAYSQKNDPKLQAIERHYQYLENENKSSREAIQKESEVYRKFIQEERAEHQKFLERTYTIAGIIISLIVFGLSFFGWSTFKGIKDSRKELEAAATKKLLDFENSIREYQSRFAVAQEKLIHAENEYNRYLAYYKDSDPRKGRYLLIGDQEKLDQMAAREIPRFQEALGKLEVLSTTDLVINGLYEASYDVIIYRYTPQNEKGEDQVLEKLLSKLKSGASVPVLVYSVGQSEHIKGTTDEALKAYSLFHIANNPVTLIDNAASTYRVSKLSLHNNA